MERQAVRVENLPLPRFNTLFFHVHRVPVPESAFQLVQTATLLLAENGGFLDTVIL